MFHKGQLVRVVRPGSKWSVNTYQGAPERVYVLHNLSPANEPAGRCHLATTDFPDRAVYVCEYDMLDPVDGPW